MLDKVVFSKSKNETVNLRVDMDTKIYLKQVSKKLNTNISAYIYQLIENDKNEKCLNIYLDDDIYDRLKTVDDKSSYINNILKGGL
jgi:hypothetical protein